MADIQRFIVSPRLMRAALGAMLVGSLLIFPSLPEAQAKSTPAKKAPPKSQAKSDPKEEYLEQVGAYSKLENAATMVETLRAENKNAFIRQKTVDGRLVFVVLVEPVLVKNEAKPAPKPAPKPEPKTEAAKETPKPAPKPSAEPKMETVIVTDTMPQAVQPAPKPAPAPAPTPAPAPKPAPAPTPAPVPAPTPAPAPAPVPAPAAEQKAPLAPTAQMAQAPITAPAPAATRKGPVVAPPSAVVLPVTKADATESIEVMSDVYVYDRPFTTGKPIGTYAETGGAYVKEYLGWYAIKLPSGANGFIKKEDADIIDVTVGQAQ